MIINVSKKTKFDTESSMLTFDETFVKNDIRQFLMEDKKRRMFSESRIINTINMIPTMMCDGACSYCYNINELNQGKSFLDFETFENTMEDLITKGAKIELHTVKLYGGEPLLNPKLDSLLINILKKYNIETLYISSGLLFNDKKFKAAIEKIKNILKYYKDLTIGISVDFGLTDEQFTRVSNKAFINRNILLKRGEELQKIGVTVVYTSIVSRNVDMDLLKTHITKHFRSSKYPNFFYRLSVANSDDLYPTEDQIYSLYNLYNELYDKVGMTSNLFSYTDVVNFPNVFKIDKNNYMFVYPSNYCGMFDNMITILPDGQVTACQMEPDIESSTMSKEQHDYFFKNEKCDNCDFYPVCRGLCVNRNLQAPEAMDVYCLWAKLSFELALKRSYVLAGGTDEQFKKYIDNISLKTE